MVAPHGLADDHIDRLVKIVRDESGDHLTRPDFTEAILKLFEDIAGFETLTTGVFLQKIAGSENNRLAS